MIHPTPLPLNLRVIISTPRACLPEQSRPLLLLLLLLARCPPAAGECSLFFRRETRRVINF